LAVVDVYEAGLALHDCSLEYPIFNSDSRSLKSQILRGATGGFLSSKTGEKHVSVNALSNLSFTLKQGDRLAILGHNGSGKSTLLRLLAGVYEPTSGQIERRGDVSSLIDITLGLSPESTGLQNIYIRGAFLGLKKSEIDSVLDEIIDFSELGNFISMPVRTYSTGMLVRLAFAIATQAKPEILLMDEWLSVGDENFRAKAEARLKTVVDAAKILVLATHSRHLAEATCNVGVVLEHGQVKHFGEINEICDLYFGQ
jgi:lipopolysaccharide transport system ATP-binding protein